jgi:hypothetical protein
LSPDQIPWIAGVFLSGIAINVAILKLVADNKIYRPNLLGISLNSVLTIVGGSFLYSAHAFLFSLLFALQNTLFIVFIWAIAKQRDIHAVRLAEWIQKFLLLVDNHITFILGAMLSKDPPEVIRAALEKAYKHIADGVWKVLGLKGEDQSEVTLLRAEAGRFKVLGEVGVPPEKLKKVEELMTFSPNVIGIAGLAAARCTPVFIPDLSDELNKDVKHWIRLSANEQKRGSILAYPVTRSNEGTQIVAVICVTSVKKHAFNKEATQDILLLIAPKVEALVACGDLISGLLSEVQERP